jgi:hypothetical protein
MKQSFKLKLLILHVLMMTIGMYVLSFPQTPTLAVAQTIQTSFLSETSTWTNKNNESTNNSIILSPYRITSVNPGTSDAYTYVMSVGAYDSGASPNRVIFGALASTMTSSYNLNHPSLSAYKALTTVTYSSVLALETPLKNVRITELALSWTSGTRDDQHDVNFIYSTNLGNSWQRLGTKETITTGSNSGSLSIVESIQGSYMQVGLLLENTVNFNNDAINMINPTMTITYQPLSDQESSDQLTSEVILYSPCGNEDNQYFMISEEKKQEFIDKYNRLSSSGQSIFQSTIIEGGVTAYQRYIYLIQ